MSEIPKPVLPQRQTTRRVSAPGTISVLRRAMIDAPHLGTLALDALIQYPLAWNLMQINMRVMQIN